MSPRSIAACFLRSLLRDERGAGRARTTLARRDSRLSTRRETFAAAWSRLGMKFSSTPDAAWRMARRPVGTQTFVAPQTISDYRRAAGSLA